MEPAGANLAVPRGLLTVGGFTLARHQLALALALDCQRVIVVAREFGPGMVGLQHEAEKAGVPFHVITGARPIAGLVTAHDELIVLVDGLLAMPQEAAALLGSGPCILVQPVEVGTAAGFERIDLNNAAAGAMRIPGRLAERLSELPADCDVASALTRIALQDGVRQVALPAGLREGAGWRLIRDEHDAQHAEAGWIRQLIGETAAKTPGPLLGGLLVRRFGPSLLHAGSGSRTIVLAAGVSLLVALISSWYGYPAVGLMLFGLAWFARHAAGLLARVEREAMRLARPAISREELFGWLTDAMIVLAIVWNFPDAAGQQGWLDKAFAPVLLLLVLRIVSQLLPPTTGDWLRDRLVLCLVLAAAAFADAMLPTVRICALLAALAGVIAPLLANRITRT